ncbi:MAG: hypothetical protein AAF791_15855 [Bacteroidota bacterium]
MRALLRLLVVCSLTVVTYPAIAQVPVFDPNGSSTDARVSGTDVCDSEQPYICNEERHLLRAETGEPNEMLSSLQFGFAGGRGCSVTAPRPVNSLQVVPVSRRWNECPNGTANRTYTLSTTALPGPDYGLNRLRICTDSDGKLQGAEARFFKLPQASRRASGQTVVTRQFERRDCTTWQSWSTCPSGQSASGLRIYTHTLNAGDVKGIRLVCRRVLASPAIQGR